MAPTYGLFLSTLPRLHDRSPSRAKKSGLSEMMTEATSFGPIRLSKPNGFGPDAAISTTGYEPVNWSAKKEARREGPCGLDPP